MLSELMMWLGVWLGNAAELDGDGDPFPPRPR
jgi:hypothetical protein